MEIILRALHFVTVFEQLFITSCRERKSINIALRKPASQSSSFFDFKVYMAKAERAVDGDVKNDMNSKSCSSTALKDESSTWWEVDLLDQHTINDVRMLNRDILAERLHDITVDVYERKAKPRNRKHCITHPGLAGPGWLNLSCESPVTGRHVRITKPKNDLEDALTLCEVEIYQGADALIAKPSLLKGIRTTKNITELSYLNCCSICG